MLSEQGELVRVHGRDIRSVRPLDPGFATKLTAALDALSPRSAQVTRPLKLFGETPEAEEGIRAFNEKRQPDFSAYRGA